jgi:Cu/Ag efflux protein CusF
MRRLATLLLLVLFVAACADEAPKPVSEPGEKLYPLRGTILSRVPAANILHIKHDEIPGFMKAMTMDFAVRGAQVTDLPPDNTSIEATLHVTSRAWWITDVRAAE